MKILFILLVALVLVSACGYPGFGGGEITQISSDGVMVSLYDGGVLSSVNYSVVGGNAKVGTCVKTVSMVYGVLNLHVISCMEK